jgi:hypothetical protein
MEVVPGGTLWELKNDGTWARSQAFNKFPADSRTTAIRVRRKPTKIRSNGKQR